jgi:nucleotide-binding universal stress UspA family protein
MFRYAAAGTTFAAHRLVRLSKILCPVDFSEPSREAVHYAADLAQQFGSELILLSVYQVPGYALPDGVLVAGPETLTEIASEVDRQLDAWRREAEQRGATNVRTDSAMGAPHTEIVRYAADRGIELVVIGTHGRTGLKHVLLGSTAEKVVRTAPCPVLTVRQADHQFHGEALSGEPSGAPV